MTNARAHFVRHWQRCRAPSFVATGLAISLLAMPLAGCETANSALGSGTGGTNSVAAAPQAQGRAKLVFAPIVGAPAAVAENLSAGVSGALARQSIPIAKSPADGPDYTVRGYVVAAPDKAGTKLSYIWDVTDKTGQRAQRFTGEEIVKSTKKSKDPWANIDQGVIDRIANASAGQLAAWVPMKAGGAPIPGPAADAAANTSTQSGFGSTTLGQLFGFGSPSTPANAAPAATASTSAPVSAPAQTASLPANPPGQPPGSLISGDGKAPQSTASLPSGPAATTVATVTGAPGDGAQSLTRALQANLRNRGIEAQNGVIPGAYTVQGRVVMGQPSGGKQTIKIEWQVLDPAGKKKGTVWQNNVVPQGALDGPWGKTADDAAAEAAKGIVELLPKKA